MYERFLNLKPRRPVKNKLRGQHSFRNHRSTVDYIFEVRCMIETNENVTHVSLLLVLKRVIIIGTDKKYGEPYTEPTFP
jgi:hypothetical protein